MIIITMFTYLLIRSKNIKSEEFDDNDESLKNSESGDSAVGSGMFKQMKSIDDKVNQV